MRHASILENAGHQVVSVETVREALDYVGSALPPLVVIDVTDAGDEAHAACREIKADHPDTFVLQISPTLLPESRLGETEPAVDAFLVDPIDPLEMLVLTRSLLRLQKVEADLRDSEERLLLAQKSAGLAILDWVISSNTFIHSENFADVFDLAPRAPDEALTPAHLLERIHPQELEALVREFSHESLSARDFQKEFRIICRDGSVRWIASRGRLFTGPGGIPERMLSLNFDITQRKTSERTNAELAAIVASSSDAIIGIDLTAHITSWNTGAERLFGRPAASMIGQPLAEALPSLSAEEQAAFRRDLANGERHELERRETRTDGTIIDLWIRSAPILAGEDLIGASLSIRDVSQQKQREEHVRFLMRELTHRSKNLLAVIQAMARQSLTRDISPNEFVRRFTDRLAGLAGSHDLLSRVDWKGASLMELIRSQLNHYMDLFGTRILLEGTDLALRPEAAQNFGIALHELSTNAAKYGALSNETGQVTISWSRVFNGERLFKLCWQERGGPPVVAPTRKGFGHIVKERIAGTALGGKTTFVFEETGVVWTLSVPMATVLIEGS
jgi:PAS domain S-box-containing protein